MLFIFAFISCSQEESTFQYFTEAVDFQRYPSPHIIEIPDSLIDKSGIPFLQSEKTEKLFPLQRLTANQWVFISDTLPTGESDVYALRFSPEEPDSEVVISQKNGQLTVHVDNRSVLTYQMETIYPPEGFPQYYQRGGYIHPAYSPGGEIITDGFPLGHMHQHGIFFAWVNTLFQGRDTDFWNQQDETGTVLFDSLISVVQGPVYGEFVSSQTAVAFNGQDTIKVLAERWNVKVYNVADYFVWDIQVQQENISDEVLQILPYHYGGMAFRGSSQWNDTTAVAGVELAGPGQGGFLTSDGYGRKGNHTNPAWVSMFGAVDGSPVNLTVMGSDQNYRVPQYVRIHPTMPYFCFTPVVEYGFDFNPGDIYKATYRVFTFEGDPDVSTLNSLWKQYQTRRTIDKSNPI
ncbi:MAG: PmoA family protein [Bacteroidota bacterium]